MSDKYKEVCQLLEELPTKSPIMYILHNNELNEI